MISTIEPCLAPLTRTVPLPGFGWLEASLLRTTTVSTNTLPYWPGQRALHVAVVPLTAIWLLATPGGLGSPARGATTREIYSRVPPFIKKARAAWAV